MGHFTGEFMTLPYGQDGLNGAENLDLVEPNQLIVAENMSFTRGGISRDGGASKFNSSALSGGVIGVYDWWPSAGVQRTIAFTDDGAAYRDTGAATFATTLRSGQAWSSATVPVFVEAGAESAGNNHKLFIFLGALNQVQVLAGDGVTISDIGATKPADWAANYPVTGANHAGRLWGGGNSNDPHRVYYSTITSNEDFTGAGSGSIAVFPGEGDGIVAMLSFKGLLIVWKYPRGVYIVNTTDPTATNWSVSRISASVGGASPRCFCIIDDDVLFMNANGSFHRLTGIQEYGDVGTSDIGRRIHCNEWQRRNLNPSSFTKTRAVYYTTKREAHFSVASQASSTWDYRMVWDLNADTPRLRINTFPNGPELYRYLDSSGLNRFGCADANGFIWRCDTSDFLYNGGAYSSRSRSAAIAIDPEVQRKNARFFELSFVPKGLWNLTLIAYWDDDQHDGIGFSMSGGGVGLGTFILGTNALGSDGYKRVRYRTVGSGFRLSVELYNSGAGQDYALSNIRLLYTLGSDSYAG